MAIFLFRLYSARTSKQSGLNSGSKIFELHLSLTLRFSSLSQIAASATVSDDTRALAAFACPFCCAFLRTPAAVHLPARLFFAVPLRKFYRCHFQH
ncbi:MAG: hypothetical protein K8S22_12445 [Betaproteobacteria bacterium]|nr:hypothetical protein [Betaproteobacteria bacterium]